LKATESVIQYLEKIDRSVNQEDNDDDDPSSVGDSTKLARVKREAKSNENNFDDVTIFDVSHDDTSLGLEADSSGHGEATALFLDNDDDFGKL